MTKLLEQAIEAAQALSPEMQAEVVRMPSHCLAIEVDLELPG
jgi:hypothetical protein